MSNKYLITVSNNTVANSIEQEILANSNWKNAGIVSANLPLLSALSVVENIMLPLCYSEKMSRGPAEAIVQELLTKFGLEDALHYRQKRLNEYEILIVKFLRAIMRCPKQVIFIMPHIMLPSEEYASFTVFANSLPDFDITIIEQEKFVNDYIETNFTEITYLQWQTHVLNILS